MRWLVAAALLFLAVGSAMAAADKAKPKLEVLAAGALHMAELYKSGIAGHLQWHRRARTTIAAGESDPYAFEELALLYERKQNAGRAAHYRELQRKAGG